MSFSLSIGLFLESFDLVKLLFSSLLCFLFFLLLRLFLVGFGILLLLLGLSNLYGLGLLLLFGRVLDPLLSDSSLRVLCLFILQLFFFLLRFGLDFLLSLLLLRRKFFFFFFLLDFVFVILGFLIDLIGLLDLFFGLFLDRTSLVLLDLSFGPRSGRLLLEFLL